MNTRFLLLACITLVCWAGKPKPKTAKHIQADIQYLSNDKLEGRRTGSAGEKLAADYIAKRFTKLGISPFWKNSYLQNFSVQTGKKINPNTQIIIHGQSLANTDFVPMVFGGNGSLGKDVALVPISSVTQKNISNPHDEALTEFYNQAKNLASQSFTAIVFYNDIDTSYDAKFLPESKTKDSLHIPVVYINHQAYQQYILPQINNENVAITGQITLEDSIRTGINVAAFINNNAAKSVVIGAHFDHLGYGQDHNSRSTDAIPQIHNGADDNASGVAGMLALAELLKNGNANNYNYILVSFSGEELGLFGSKKFIENNPEILGKIHYMINLDMIGRFENDKNSLTIGGVGTSPEFVPNIIQSKPFFTPKYDSSGVGPSDHTSFYLKDIPVLFFFTGLHTDYHKPSDDADKINYEAETKIINYIHDLINTLNQVPNLSFTKTKEPKMEGAKFKVSLGIMPDYTFSGTGIRADGVIDGKIAKRAGIQAGDIITQLGNKDITDMQNYMAALASFKKGDATSVTVLRGKQVFTYPIVFE